ncbi:MAG: hypothetical protein ABIH00_06475 [Armatimonadota bacterium]
MTKFYFASVIPIILSVYLISKGLQNIKIFNAAKDLTSVITLGGLPVLVGTAILVVIISLFMSNKTKTVTISRDFLKISLRGKCCNIEWGDLIFYSTPPGKKNFKQLTLTDGKNLIRVDEFFYPEYKFLHRFLSNLKEQKRREPIDIA